MANMAEDTGDGAINHNDNSLEVMNDALTACRETASRRDARSARLSRRAELLYAIAPLQPLFICDQIIG